jgi:hypothetical protein
MKRFLLGLPLLLAACLQAPSPEVKPSLEETFKPTLLGSVTLHINNDLSVQGAKFIPNPRLSSQTLSPVTESTLVFTRETLVNIDRAGGERYLNAPFKVTNNNAGNLQNLTLVAYHKNGNVGGSAFKDIQTFGGTLNPNVNTLLPVHTMTTAGGCSSVPCVDNDKADLQIFTRGEIDTLTLASDGSLINNSVTGEGILHYGFIARKGSTGTYRTIAGTACNPGANAGCNEGTLNIALRVPTVNDPGQLNTAYRYSMTFLVFTDSAARVTESIEEQGTTNAATRATALGGSPEVAAMCGTSLSSGAATYITGVRTVGVGINTETALMGGKFLITDNTAPNYTVNGNIAKSFNAAAGVLSTRFSALGGATLSTAPVGTPTNSSNIVVNTDGSLSIDPAVNLRTTDSFNYSISDGTCTWTRPAGVTIQNAVTWFVKNNVASTGNGRFSSPFKTLAEAQTASAANDTIYVYNGDNTTTGQNAGITLKAGQKLIGQGVALTVGGDTIEAAGTKPVIGNSGGNAITLNSGNTLQGLLVGNTPAANYSVSGTSVGTLNVSDVNVNNTTGAALNLGGGTPNATFGSISSNASSSDAVVFSNLAGTFSASTISITNTTGTARGVNITSGTGTFNLGTVNINTTGSAGLFVNGNTPTINATSVTVSNSGSRGILAQGVTGGTITLDTIAISNSAVEGIASTTNNNTININGGSIQNSTSNNIYIAGGTGNFSYTGSITDTNNSLVYIENTTGGTKTFSGAMNGNGANIGLVNNTGATINFSGALSLSTASQPAFTATGGGTVNVTGTTNTLTTTTGTALNVANTTIGSSNLNFRSISANGAASGIILNNTGSSGGLVVTGTGSAGSGGTIQNTTSDGIFLTSTQSPSFARMNIASTAGYGVKGTQVTNFSFTDGSISNSGTGLGTDSANIGFNTSIVGTERNLSGVVTITGNTLTNAYYHGVDISNLNGTITDATISSNIITSATAAANSKGSGIRLRALGSASTVAKVTKATMASNTISNFPSGSGIVAQAGNADAAGSPTVFGTAGSGTDIISITGNLIAGETAGNRMGASATPALGTAITASVTQINSASRATAHFNISNNGTVASPLAQIAGNGIVVLADEYSDATATVSNNVLVTNNTLGSPSIFLIATNSSGVATANPSLNVTANSNNISQSDGNGILAAVRASNGTMQAKIQSNTVAAPLTGNRSGIRVDSGNSTGNATVCLNISGNTSAGVGLVPEGISLRKQGTVSTTNTFGINGMAATATPGIETYVNGLNPAGNNTLLVSATSGFSNCSLP